MILLNTKACLLTLVSLSIGFGQVPVTPYDARPTPPKFQPTISGTSGAHTQSSATPATGSADLGPDYVLGPGDVLTMSEIDIDDMLTDKTFRIDNSGDVNFPLVGRLHAAGLTEAGLEAEVNSSLKKYIVNPAAVIGVTEFHSQPVSVLGAVNNPGVIQLRGSSTLYTVISLAGGLREDAGHAIQITRSLKWGAIPLPGAKPDSTGEYSLASVDAQSVLAGTDPAENIVIMPGDVISVPKADIVYAVGAVVKPGGFLVTQSGALSALQVISLAEGLDKVASPKSAMILRAENGASARTEIPVDLKQIMEGKSTDPMLQANDILFVPTSGAKAASKKAIDAIVAAATGIAIYGRF